LLQRSACAQDDAANDLLRTPGDRVIARIRTTAKEGTQLGWYCVGYAAFHRRWPFVSQYRDGRGITFAAYAATMTILFGKDAIQRKGLARSR
jgi:hypothetical protein